MKQQLQHLAIFLIFSCISFANFAQNAQWIYTTSSATLNPTSANVGIGNSADNKAKLLLSNSTSATDTLFSMRSLLKNSNQTSAYPVYGLYAENSNISKTGSLYGAYLKNTQLSAGQATSKPLYGLYLDNLNNAYSSTTYGIYSKNVGGNYSGSVYGLYSNNTMGGYSGTIYGIYSANTSTASSGSVYGVYSNVSGTKVETSYSGYFTGGKLVVMNGNVGIGYSNPTVPLDVNGIIRAHEVKICLSQGCDYVFENNYNLMPLSVLSTFVKTNKHLPEIAPAAEMESEGINVSEMNALLLKKIEELTLYIIHQQEELQKQNAEIELLKTKIQN
ncbi:MAG: hypothetical protein LBU90_00720 [Bacteroidales bacterium]|jgi:hypothetical protein|nr:hypothetical protein [Bacteroidales bacterium]